MKYTIKSRHFTANRVFKYALKPRRSKVKYKFEKKLLHRLADYSQRI